jgi:hypothetical protein
MPTYYFDPNGLEDWSWAYPPGYFLKPRPKPKPPTNIIPNPCGTFTITNPGPIHGRPGIITHFDPSNCNCTGTIKLVQVISWPQVPGLFRDPVPPHYDIQDPDAVRNQRFPGYRDSGWCKNLVKKRPELDTPPPKNGPPPIIDAPFNIFRPSLQYDITVCAVCTDCKTETLLGCFSFSGTGISGAYPDEGVPFPGGQPGPDFDEADRQWWW